MKAIKIFILIFIFIYVNNQVPSGKALNSCGKKKDYSQPDNKEDCVDDTEGELCCFVHLTNKNDESKIKKFCAVAPSKIEKDDIAQKIEEYTDYKLTELSCMNSKYIQIGSLFILFFILF